MNILVIRTHRLGDILQLTPMVKAVKQAYPESNISFLVGKRFAALLEGNPHIDEIIYFPENEYRYWLKNNPEKYPSMFNEMYDFISELRQRAFAMIINRQYEWGAMLAHLIGAEKVLGGCYSPEKGFHFEDRPSRDLYHAIRNNRKANRRNLTDWACRIAGVSPENTGQMVFRVSRRARREAEALLTNQAEQGDKPLVGVQAGAARSFRQWGVENFAELVEWLIAEKGKRVVLIGSEGEKDLGDHLDHMVSFQEPRLIDLIGRTSLETLGAVLEKCECLVTGDTGPMHMAAAVGAPVLALFFGTAYPWETGPYGPGHVILYSDIFCAPCLDPALCRHDHRCKAEIMPDAVMRAFEAAEAFRREKPMCWKPVSDRVKLFVTAAGKQGEQILLPASKDAHLLIRPPQRRSHENGVKPLYPEGILTKGDEVIHSFLTGESEHGFTSLTQYLDYWMEAKDAVAGKHPGVKERLSVLLSECLRALQAKDIVTLMDAVEYGFKPLIHQALCSFKDDNSASLRSS